MRRRTPVDLFASAALLLCVVLALTSCTDLVSGDTDSTSTSSTSSTEASTTSESTALTAPPATPATEAPSPATDTTEEGLRTVYYNETAHAEWTGSWAVSENANDSSGRSKYTHSHGSSVTLEFYGTMIGLESRTGPSMASATITLAGPVDRGPVTLSFYNDTTLYRQMVWLEESLPLGYYTVTVEYAGPSSWSPKPPIIYVDGWWMTGNIE